jgi:DUF4097 and DUF4098 domain-containing protein YvlB
MTDSRQTVSAAGISRLTLDTSGADVLVQWDEQLEDIVISGDQIPVERTGDEVFIRADLARVRTDDHPDAELRITGFESPGHMVEEILKQTGLFGGLGRSRKGSPLVVMLPHSVRTSVIEVEHGDLRLDQPRGSVDCKLKRGNFVSNGGTAELEVAAGLGEVQISGLKGTLMASGGSGNITLTDVNAITNVRAGSGEITLIRVAGDAIKLAAGSGDITVRQARAEAYSSDCGSGDVLLDGGRLERISIRTGSGDVRCTATFGAHAQSFTTGSGTVSLSIPRDISARIEAFTSGGAIDTDLPLVSVGQRGPKSRRSRRQVGSVGSGDPRAEVSVRTSSGDIRVHWLPHAAVEPIPMPAPVESPATPPVPPHPPAIPREPDVRADNESAGLDERQAVLESLARGEISVDEADALLETIESRRS